MSSSAWLAIVFLSLCLAMKAWARPEYAAREKINCMSCHAMPWGGGPRTILGKNYGSHGHQPSPLSTFEYVYADVRAIGYYPIERTAARGNGFSLMQASVTGSAPVYRSENNAELRGVLTFNIAPLSGSHLREALLRFSLPAQKADEATVLTVGRFYAPFGLLTDEHRTYTRIQTNSTINNYFLGAAVSGNPLSPLHYDLVALNDLQGSGSFNVGDITWAAVANLRWNPATLPFLVGASGNYQRSIVARDPYASSVYAVLALSRITKGKINATLSGERVDAWGWNQSRFNTGALNPGLPQFFVPDTSASYLASVASAHSAGYYAMARYYLRHDWNLFYKFDYLDLDAGRSGGRFARHGFGIEAFVHSNITLNARYEKAYVEQDEIASSDVLANHDDVFLMLRAWL